MLINISKEYTNVQIYSSNLKPPLEKKIKVVNSTVFKLMNIRFHKNAFDEELKLLTEIYKCNRYGKN